MLCAFVSFFAPEHAQLHPYTFHITRISATNESPSFFLVWMDEWIRNYSIAKEAHREFHIDSAELVGISFHSITSKWLLWSAFVCACVACRLRVWTRMNSRPRMRVTRWSELVGFQCHRTNELLVQRFVNSETFSRYANSWGHCTRKHTKTNKIKFGYFFYPLHCDEWGRMQHQPERSCGNGNTYTNFTYTRPRLHYHRTLFSFYFILPSHNAAATSMMWKKINILCEH